MLNATPHQAETRSRIAGNLLRIMKNKHMEKKDLAKAAGVSYNHIKRIELEQSDATVLFLEKLATVLGVSVRQIIV